MSKKTYSSPEIAKELIKQFGTTGTVKVEMTFTREIGEFIKKNSTQHQNICKYYKITVMSDTSVITVISLL